MTRISRRRLLGTAAGGVAALATLTVRTPALAESDENEGTITAASFAKLAVSGFQAVAVLNANGYANLPGPVALTLTPEPLLKTVARHQRLSQAAGPDTTGQITSAPRRYRDSHFISKRDAFSVFFAGPAGPLLKDATYRVTHPGWKQPLSLFLVRIGKDVTKPIYQTVFS